MIQGIRNLRARSIGIDDLNLCLLTNLRDAFFGSFEVSPIPESREKTLESVLVILIVTTYGKRSAFADSTQSFASSWRAMAIASFTIACYSICVKSDGRRPERTTHLN